MKTEKVRIEYYMIATLLLYIPFHLFEESLGNFPYWMSQHWTPRILTYGHWMAGNVFFYYPLLVIGILLFCCFGEKFLFAGIGVIIWGFFNFTEHVIYTCIDLKISPGLITSIGFFVISVLTYLKLKEMGKIKIKVLIPSFLIAIVYALLPVLLQIVCGPYFKKIFI